MRASKHQPGKLKQINFVKQERRYRGRGERKRTVIFRGRLAVDSGSGDSAEVPQTHSCNIAKTGLILPSDNTKQCIIWELIVSWEEYITLANERKRSKYQELVEQRKSWKIHYDPVEVGCRGFAGQSLSRALAKIGIVGAAKVER